MKKHSKGRRNLLIVAAGTAAMASGLATLLVLSRLPGSAAGALLRPGDRSVVSLGNEIYAEHCASCHGRSLEGHPTWQVRDAQGYLPAPPHDETGHTWHHPDKLLFDITKLGVAEAAKLERYQTRMPAFEGILTDEEIIAALSFIKAQWPERIRERHDEMNRHLQKRQGAGE
ncbi:c-type cytochrome [Tianweitania sediminis]|uniref:Cytochrome c n=1 Tax=Tianweitania sediminis TaxID=1502156 RepID=A0A8J7UJL4_9HYPH|nr:cytochrome c [Tianweitania sediminis]MBP0441499.1 cytochrome c [Tianweitania sediminis]